MITSLTIEGLRGITRGTITGLAPITFFVGPNGCGKTSVLEAAALVCAFPDPAATFVALAGREWLGAAGIEPLLSGSRVTGELVARRWQGDLVSRIVTEPRGNPSARALVVRVDGTASSDAGMDISFGQRFRQVAPVMVQPDGSLDQQRAPAFEVPFARLVRTVESPAAALGIPSKGGSSLRAALGVLKPTARYDALIDALRALRPNLLGIELMPMGELNEPWIFEGPPRVGYPLAYAGDGFARAVLFASVLAQAHQGVAAIDEPEAYAHPRMFDALASLLKAAVASKTQVLFATHSLEFIETVVRAFRDDAPDAVSVIGLRLEGGELESFPERGEEAYRRIVTLKDDLRL